MADDVTLLPLGGEGKALQASFEAYRDAVHARIADLEAQLADARDWSSTLADAADDLRAELREARERNTELEAELADVRAEYSRGRCYQCRYYDREEERCRRGGSQRMAPDNTCPSWERTEG